MRKAPLQRAAVVGCGRERVREWTFEGNGKFYPFGIECIGDGMVHRYENRYIARYIQSG